MNEEKLKIVENLNQKLKTLTTWEEFQEFLKEMHSYDCSLWGKRRSFYVYNFLHVYENKGYYDNPYAGKENYKNRVEYLYSDGYSTGCSYIKNLWKVLKVE